MSNLIEYEKKLYVPLREANLSGISKGHDHDGYVILPGCLGSDRYEQVYGEEMSYSGLRQYNNDCISDIINELRGSGYSYTKVLGEYKYENGQNSFEKSFIVYPYNNLSGETFEYEDFFKDMFNIGRKHHQESILRKASDEKACYIDCDTGERTLEFDGAALNDITEEYFIALKKFHFKSEGKSQRFIYEAFTYVPSSLSSMHTSYAMNELFYNGKESSHKLKAAST